MIQHGFILDINRCTGCNACQLACTLENQLDFETSWRQIVTFNPDLMPNISVFHLSLACNHCADPDCLKYCPTLAYYKDPISGHVLLNTEYCIGCKYCSWLCPYDAPVYDSKSGIMTKCTFCDHRYKEGLEPACVSLCPTEALSTGMINPDRKTNQIPGLPSSKMQPAIDIIPLRSGRRLSYATSLPFDYHLMEQYRDSLRSRSSKISFGSEWTLMIFTLVAALLVGDSIAYLFSAGMFTPTMYIILLALGVSTSIIHLGKKTRANFAVLNVRRSWLSREIILFCGFTILILLIQYLPKKFPPIEIVAAVIGLTAVYAIDQVYRILPDNRAGKWHSASVLLTALLFASVLSGQTAAIYILLSIKFRLFLKINLTISAELKTWQYNSLVILRVISGFIILPLFWALLLSSQIFYIWIFLVSEAADRILFYLSLKITTPSDQIIKDFKSCLHTSA